MYKLSGVLRSINQYAPPYLNDGIFSAMVEIWGKTQVTRNKSKCTILNSKTKPAILYRMLLEKHLSYSDEKADKDGPLNKKPFQWRKRSHTISAII